VKGSEMVDRRVMEYAQAHTTPASEARAAVGAKTQEATASPGMMSGLVEGRLLEALVVATRARRVLEIGTFTGAGTLAMAARLPDDGRLITIEKDEQHVAIARRHIEASPYASRIEMIAGDALEAIGRVEGPFDLVFIDAWKREYERYYEAALPKLAPHGIIVADNVLWSGTVADPANTEDDTAAIRAFNDRVQSDPRVHNALLTVGDGLLLIWHAR
jgi:caffeoyl-CoA O-methyltransferase